MSPTTTLAAECPDCAASITLNGPLVGEITDCPDCGVELEVTATTPLSFAHAPEEAEDWGE